MFPPFVCYRESKPAVTLSANLRSTPRLTRLIMNLAAVQEKSYQEARMAQWNAYLATVNVMTKLLNMKPTPSKTDCDLDTATFRVGDNPFTWIVQCHPRSHRPAYDVDIRQTQPFTRTPEIRLWKIIVRDYAYPQQDWTKPMVDSILASQTDAPSNGSILLTTSWRLSHRTEKRLYSAKIRKLRLRHSPSENEGLDEMTEILTKYITRKTIDPKRILQPTTSLDKWVIRKEVQAKSTKPKPKRQPVLAAL